MIVYWLWVGIIRPRTLESPAFYTPMFTHKTFFPITIVGDKTLLRPDYYNLYELNTVIMYSSV